MRREKDFSETNTAARKSEPDARRKRVNATLLRAEKLNSINQEIKIRKIDKEASLKAAKNLSTFGILIGCALALSAGVDPFSGIFQSEEVRFEKEFVLDDDSMPGDIFFESPSTVCCDPEGNIYVADSSAENIKKFDVRGKFLKVIGREGQGPGEFGRLYYSAFAKDRLIVWDSGNRRLCSFTSDGDCIDSVNIPYDAGSVRMMRGFPAGGIAIEMEKNFRSEPDKPQECRIDLYTEDLELVKTIYKRDLWRKKYIRTEEYGTTTLYFPYCADVRWDILPDGRLVVGYSDEYRADLFDRNGKKISTITHDAEPVPVSGKDKKAYFDSLVFYRGGERLKEVPEYITKYTEFPKNKPVYKNILADSEGNIWVVLNRKNQEEDGKVFDVFSRSGSFVSRVRLKGEAVFPDHRNAYFLDNGRFLSIETGEDDLYRVIVYRISGSHFPPGNGSFFLR